MSTKRRQIAVVGAAVGAVLLGATGSAAAAVTPDNAGRAAAPAPNSITGSMVKDGTLYGADLAPATVAWFTGTWNNTVTSASVKDGSLALNDFSAAAKDGLKGAKGDQGTTGTTGTTGATGATGPQGPAGTWSGTHWGSVLRNTIGVGSAELKPTSTTAPQGAGALELNTSSATDKAAFGNEVDFLGDDVSAIQTLGFSVYTTGENSARGPGNMPSITFEIDPNLAALPAANYASMVFAPFNSASNTWTAINATDDALGKVWGLTGAGMPCGINGARCTWSEMKAALNDGGEGAKVGTLAVGKGRDFEFHGAVDKLLYNDDVFDFEPMGVK